MAWSKSTARIQPSSRAATVRGSSVIGSSTAGSGTPVPHRSEGLEVAGPGCPGDLDPVEAVDQRADLAVVERPRVCPRMGGAQDVDETLQIAPGDRGRP